MRKMFLICYYQQILCPPPPMKVPLRYIIFNPTFILLGNSDRRKQVVKPVPCKSVSFYQGLHRLEKYLNIQDCLEKSLKIKLALKST